MALPHEPELAEPLSGADRRPGGHRRRLRRRPRALRRRRAPRDGHASRSGAPASSGRSPRVAVERDLPVLGICGGQQLLNVVLGGTLIQHIPDAVPGALAHEQPNPRTEPGPRGVVVPGSLLHRITGADRLPVNSAHHQAAERVGPGVVVSAAAPGRRDRGDRGPAAALLPRRAVASRIRHQPPATRADRGLRRRGGTAMRATAAERRVRIPPRRADRQADRARRAVLAPRRRGLDRRPPGRGRRHAC